MIKRILAFILIFNAISIVSLISYVGYNSIVPSLEGTGIGLTDLIFNSKDIPPDKMKMLHDKVMVKASQLGDQTGTKLFSVLENLFIPKYDPSKAPAAITYPYQSPGDIADHNAELGKQAAKDALQQMQTWDQTIFTEARKQGLQNAQNNEKYFQIIKEQTLKPN